MKRATTLCGALLVALSILLVSAASATNPGRNGLIAYVADNALYSMYPDGSHKKKLTKSTYDTQYATLHLDSAAYPKWSPDGKKIAFVASTTPVSGGEQNTNVVVMNSDGSDLHWVGGTAAVGRLAWSPDGSEIAYAVPTYLGSPDRHILVTRTDNTGGRTLAWNDSFDPAWSPDGRVIVFVTHGSIDAVDPDGYNRRTLISRYALRPDWSPDGSQLLFEGTEVSGDPGTIYTANADGSEMHPVYDRGSLDGYAASWSPDGTKIVLTVEDDNYTESIKYLTPDGTVHGLTFGPALGAMPDWQPCGLGTRCPDTTPCVVPRVMGFPLTRARSALHKAHCAVGTIKRLHHVALAKAVVSKQSPRAKTRLPNEARVNLVLRRRR